MDKPVVLVVDDEDAVRDLMKKLLERNGFSVITAQDGQEGLTLLTQNNIQIVLCDIKMPKVDGFEVCWRIKNNSKTKNIQVIAMTALDIPGIAKRCFAAGADDVILKPFDTKDLLDKVKKAFGRLQ